MSSSGSGVFEKNASSLIQICDAKFDQYQIWWMWLFRVTTSSIREYGRTKCVAIWNDRFY